MSARSYLAEMSRHGHEAQPVPDPCWTICSPRDMPGPTSSFSGLCVRFLCS